MRGADDHAQRHRPGHALPRLLGADRGRHRVPAGEDAGGVAADVVAHGDRDEGEHPQRAVRHREHEHGETREERDVGRDEHRGRHVPGRPVVPVDDPPEQDAEGGQRERHQQAVLAGDERGDEHAERADAERDDRDLDPLRPQRAGELPQRHEDGRRDDEDEHLLADEQRRQHRAPSPTPTPIAAGRFRPARPAGAAGRRRASPGRLARSVSADRPAGRRVGTRAVVAVARRRDSRRVGRPPARGAISAVSSAGPG